MFLWSFSSCRRVSCSRQFSARSELPKRLPSLLLLRCFPLKFQKFFYWNNLKWFFLLTTVRTSPKFLHNYVPLKNPNRLKLFFGLDSKTLSQLRLFNLTHSIIIIWGNSLMIVVLYWNKHSWEKIWLSTRM